MLWSFIATLFSRAIVDREYASTMYVLHWRVIIVGFLIKCINMAIMGRFFGCVSMAIIDRILQDAYVWRSLTA